MKIIIRLLKVFLFFLICGVCFVVGLYAVAKIMPKVEIKNTSSIYMYTKDKELFYQTNGTSSYVDIKDISEHMINATVSVEDKKFYNHFGFDPIRLGISIGKNIMTQSKKEGASTITQQYARNLFLTLDKTWERKLNEAWYTIRIESHYEKDDILEGYLNIINYNHGAYGIQKAANYYFNKDAKDLTLSESSMLAGIPKAPSNYSPLVNYEKAKSRQKIVLKLMVENGYITQKEADDAYNEELEFYGKWNDYDLDMISYYSDAVMTELYELDIIDKTVITTGGFKVYTNMDITVQENLEKNIDEEMGETNLQISSVVLESQTGKIIALTGGMDYKKSEFNRATSSKRQVGSIMKPLLYYSALENGFTPSTTFLSEKTVFTFSNGKTYSPSNYNDKFGNMEISMLAALAYSDNVYAVKTHMFLGEEILIDTASKVGIKENLSPDPSLALGTATINILDMAKGYSTLASGGVNVKPHLISRVEDKNGNVLYEKKYDDNTILNKSSVYILNEMMNACYSYNMVSYSSPTCLSIAPRLTNKYAIKTGSTDTDSWIVGYNKDLMNITWVGYDDSTVLTSNDSKHAKIIWAEVMEDYFTENEATWYTKPSNVNGVLINPITGKRATSSDKNVMLEYYVNGTEPGLVESDFEAVFKESDNVVKQ